MHAAMLKPLASAHLAAFGTCPATFVVVTAACTAEVGKQTFVAMGLQV